MKILKFLFAILLAFVTFGLGIVLALFIDKFFPLWAKILFIIAGMTYWIIMVYKSLGNESEEDDERE